MAEIKKSKWGGKRKGAGRKKKPGALPQAPAAPDTQKIVAEWRGEGKKEPLEIMLEAMTNEYESNGAMAAVAIANVCAPFFHSKVAVVDTSEAAAIATKAAKVDLEMKQMELSKLKAAESENDVQPVKVVIQVEDARTR